jgi:hypothetical protein
MSDFTYFLVLVAVAIAIAYYVVPDKKQEGK